MPAASELKCSEAAGFVFGNERRPLVQSPAGLDIPLAHDVPIKPVPKHAIKLSRFGP